MIERLGLIVIFSIGAWRLLVGLIVILPSWDTSLLVLGYFGLEIGICVWILIVLIFFLIDLVIHCTF